MGISAAQALQRHASSSPFWQNSSQQGEFAKHLKSALQLRPDSQDFRCRVFGIGKGPRKGFKIDKARCIQHRAESLKGNADAHNIHFLARKFSTSKPRLERRYCCRHVRRRRRLALDLHPRRHRLRRLGDYFPQALNDFCRTETGSPKGGPACAFGHAIEGRVLSDSLAKYR